MSGVYYSGGIVGSFVCDSSNVQNFFDDAYTAFSTCNWTLIRRIPSASGTSGYMVESPATPLLQKSRVAIYWNGATVPLAGFPMVSFNILDVTEAINLVCGRIWIRPQKKNRIICGPYQFFCFFDSRISPTPDVSGSGGNDASGGIPVTNLPGTALWCCGEENSFRRTLLPLNHSFEFGFSIGGNTKDTFASNVVQPTLLTTRGSELLNTIPFGDSYYPVSSAQMVLGMTTGPIVVSLWDAIMVSAFFNSPVVTNADFHDWEAYSIQCDGSVTTGCLFLATKSYESSSVGSYAH